MTPRPAFRNGIYAGALLALIIGLYLLQLWQPDRQVQLHSTHLVSALERTDWPDVNALIADGYADQWGQDRAVVLMKLRHVLQFARNLRIRASETITSAGGRDGTSHARITIDADENEIATYIKQRVNTLDEPFALQWRQQSWKPWDWKLVHVSNPALELPTY